MDDDEEDYFEVIPEFTGEDCTCHHEANDHGWGGCEVEGCECTACWVE